ncbi:MAG: DUF1707 and DUF4190 domain-containing protein [Solirubrobacteraceae bacterium]
MSIDPPDLRASDADRDAAGERLRVAALEGRLDPAELDERLSAAYAARWCSELARLTTDVTPPPATPATRPAFVRTAASTNGFAIASIVLGVVWMWWLGSVLALVFGHVALKQIARTGGAQGGRGMAIAGLVLGYLGVATLLLTFAFALG